MDSLRDARGLATPTTILPAASQRRALTLALDPGARRARGAGARARDDPAVPPAATAAWHGSLSGTALDQISIAGNRHGNHRTSSSAIDFGPRVVQRARRIESDARRGDACGDRSHVGRGAGRKAGHQALRRTVRRSWEYAARRAGDIEALGDVRAMRSCTWLRSSAHRRHDGWQRSRSCAACEDGARTRPLLRGERRSEDEIAICGDPAARGREGTGVNAAAAADCGADSAVAAIGEDGGGGGARERGQETEGDRVAECMKPLSAQRAPVPFLSPVPFGYRSQLLQYRLGPLLSRSTAPWLPLSTASKPAPTPSGKPPTPCNRLPSLTRAKGATFEPAFSPRCEFRSTPMAEDSKPSTRAHRHNTAREVSMATCTRPGRAVRDSLSGELLPRPIRRTRARESLNAHRQRPAVIIRCRRP